LALELAEELLLLFGGLEATVTKLARGVDELEVDLLASNAACLRNNALAEGGGALDGTGGRTLDHDPVVADGTVVNEATERGDALDGEIASGGGRAVLDLTLLVDGDLADAVDLLVELGSVMVAVLTGTWDGPGDARRMPCSDTSDLSETLVCLAWQTRSAPTGGDALEALALGDADDVDHLVLLEDIVDVDLLLEQVEGIVDLLGDRATVDLDLEQVCLLGAETQGTDLRVRNETHARAVLLDASEIAVNGLGALLGSILERVLGEGLLLGAVPVLVESALGVVAHVLCPDGGQRARAMRSIDVTNDTNDDQWWRLEDGDSLKNLLLVDL
jgi:hypothetical protein